MEKKTEWFQHWFDTKYYHLLYEHRDDEEAQFFMQNLIDFLDLKKGDRLLDLPCGKGRHSVFLNSKGFEVVGADLSKNSIDFAKQFETETLQFRIHDMREPLLKKYNTIFNLFTSFGYFEEDDANISVLKNFKNALLKNGKIVIDFLNIDKIKKHLITDETFEKNGVIFHITKEIKDEILIKEIYFDADGTSHHYTEKVQCLTIEKMTKLASMGNLKVQHVFGDYNLNAFDKTNSDRLILILQ
jgi:cyclopropane fatty-acyl-phospholipid synthase-like methyltransferase